MGRVPFWQQSCSALRDAGTAAMASAPGWGQPEGHQHPHIGKAQG